MAVWSFKLIMGPFIMPMNQNWYKNESANKSFYLLRLRNQWKEGGDPSRPFALVSSIEFSSQPFSEWRKIKNSSTDQAKGSVKRAKKTRATCFATLLQNELKRDVAGRVLLATFNLACVSLAPKTPFPKTPFPFPFKLLPRRLRSILSQLQIRLLQVAKICCRG